jgi:hypothetical protein
MAGAVALAFVTPWGRDFFELHLPPPPIVTASFVAVGISAAAMLAADRVSHRRWGD